MCMLFIYKLSVVTRCAVPLCSVNFILFGYVFGVINEIFPRIYGSYIDIVYIFLLSGATNIYKKNRQPTVALFKCVCIRKLFI